MSARGARIAPHKRALASAHLVQRGYEIVAVQNVLVLKRIDRRLQNCGVHLGQVRTELGCHLRLITLARHICLIGTDWLQTGASVAEVVRRAYISAVTDDNKPRCRWDWGTLGIALLVLAAVLIVSLLSVPPSK